MRHPLLLSSAFILAVSAHAVELQCQPVLQIACDASECSRQTVGFQHAESFAFNTRTNVLGACLWTNCYSAQARVIRTSPKAVEFTAIAALKPENVRAGDQPRIVSLTVDEAMNFIAVWSYQGSGLVFDHGQCTESSQPPKSGPP